jgi:hypothetical protein
VTSATLARTPSLFEPAGGERVLDEVIVRVWEELTANRSVGCPVCAADMEPEYSAHALPVGGRCSRCGSTFR